MVPLGTKLWKLDLIQPHSSRAALCISVVGGGASLRGYDVFVWRGAGLATHGRLPELLEHLVGEVSASNESVEAESCSSW